MLANLYDEARAADAAGFLLHAAKKPLEASRLDCLLYLAERATLKETGYPLTGDFLLSTPDGMVLERWHRHLESFRQPNAPKRLLALLQGNVTLHSPDVDAETVFLELNANDRERITRTWNQYGKLSASELKDITTTRCNEWLGPNTTKRIPYDQVLPHLGYSSAQVSALLARMAARATLNAAFDK